MLCPRCNREIPDDALLCCYCARSITRQPRASRKLPNGTGTVFQRKGQTTWTAQITDPDGWFIDEDGKRYRRYKTKGGFKKKTDALKYLEQLRQEAKEKTAPPLQAYWKLYSSGEMDKLSGSKQTAYKIAWGKLSSIATRRVDLLTVADLRSVVEENAPTFYPARDMKVLLSHLFTLAAADGFANKDLPSFINLPEKNETAREAFTEQEQAALWRCYESGYADAGIPLIMIYTGMMTGEMARLEGSMVNFDSNTIIGVGLKTKVRKESPVYFPDDIKPVLAELIGENTGRIFTRHKEEIYDRYYAALEKAGVRKLSPYSCRHTTATRLAVTNVIAPQTVQKIMRWSSTKMLDRYAHPDNADALAAIQTLNAKQGENPAPSGEKSSQQA
ncbi:MAG: tyrosine-type recombinase/integrase [Clostridia bacterium]|nr:tyrosine-type recombinase/integrase [Clostridia bacterium]